MNLEDILFTISTQLRIIRKSPIDLTQSTRVEPGKLISFGIAPELSPNFGMINQEKIDLEANGMLTFLKGPVPLVQGIPMSIEVRWEVQNQQEKEAIEGIDYLAPDGLDGTQASFIFIPTCVVEFTNDPRVLQETKIRKYTLIAHVTLKAGNVIKKRDEQVDVIKLAIPLSILPLKVPTIFCAYRNQHFASVALNNWNDGEESEGKALVLVPPNSSLRSKGDLIKIINDLKDKVSALSALPDFFLLNLSLDILYNSIQSQIEVQIRVGSKFNLDRISFGKQSRQCWDNKINSFIFIGPPNRSIQCSNYSTSKHLHEDKGEFNLTIDAHNVNCYTLARRLDSKKPDTEPRNNELIVSIRPKNDITFAEKLQSIEFLDTITSSLCTQITE